MSLPKINHIFNMDYKKKYYRLLATFWIMMIVGACFFWNIYDTLNTLEKDITEFRAKEILEIYIENGWMPPYEK